MTDMTIGLSLASSTVVLTVVLVWLQSLPWGKWLSFLRPQNTTSFVSCFNFLRSRRKLKEQEAKFDGAFLGDFATKEFFKEILGVPNTQSEFELRMRKTFADIKYAAQMQGRALRPEKDGICHDTRKTPDTISDETRAVIRKERIVSKKLPAMSISADEDVESPPRRIIARHCDHRAHNDAGPAILYTNGDKEWHKHGELHREDGPAIEYKDDGGIWYKNGKLHREDGPAVHRPNLKQWWINGKQLDPAKEPVPERSDAHNCIMWKMNDEVHREDGPAIIYDNGTQYWYRHGKIHREDGPAYSDCYGNQGWYLNGELLDPAKVSVPYRVVCESGERIVWRRNGFIHRDFGPAIIEPNGDQYWYQHGKRTYSQGHRAVRPEHNTAKLPKNETPPTNCTVSDIQDFLDY